jgi:hypothetical protein
VIEGSSFFGLFSRWLIGHIFISSAGYGFNGSFTSLSSISPSHFTFRWQFHRDSVNAVEKRNVSAERTSARQIARAHSKRRLDCGWCLEKQA